MSSEINSEDLKDSKFYQISKDKVLEKLGVSSKGLEKEEVGERKEKFGKNEIKEGKDISPLRIFLSQFTDFLVVILIIAAIVSYSIGFIPGQDPHTMDAVLILIILLANGIFGFFQDYKAEKSIEALKEMAQPSATIMREGKKKTMD